METVPPLVCFPNEKSKLNASEERRCIGVYRLGLCLGWLQKMWLLWHHQDKISLHVHSCLVSSLGRDSLLCDRLSTPVKPWLFALAEMNVST